jgi:Ricin-type beta-trefoil lectin domain/Putative Ig domain
VSRFTTLVEGFVCCGVVTSSSLVLAAGPALAAPQDSRPACTASHTPGVMHCLALVRTDVRPLLVASPLQPPAGYGPSSLRAAYGLPASGGSGQTVAVIDAYDDPDAAADLAVYRSEYGLPPCTAVSGCFSKVNEEGQASPLAAASGQTGWATEESLDIDMVSAICPDCHILLVEAKSPGISDLGVGLNSAVRLGAKFVSNSYGGSEYSSEISDDSAYFDHPGVAVIVSAGDNGYGTSYPAASRYVTSAGGTSLTPTQTSRGWTETVWSGTGAGCSAYEAKPAWQNDAGCGRRTDNDVAAVADPNTGVAVYDTYDQGGWIEVGGTSVSSPVIASVYALAGTPAAGTYPASYPYGHVSRLNDVTSGSDGDCARKYLCTAGPGYDAPTGWGTPDGTMAFTSGNVITVTNPGNQASVTGTPVRLRVRASDQAADQILGYAATGLPPGLSIDSSSGLISGKPAAVSSSVVTATATDGTGAAAAATFNWTVDAVGPIRSALPGRCADDYHDDAANGTKVDIRTCHGSAAQRWTVSPDGTLRIQSKCMNVTANGAKIQLWKCAGGGNEVWTAGADSALVNPRSGKCLEDPHSSTVNGTQLQIGVCVGGRSQMWQLP